MAAGLYQVIGKEIDDKYMVELKKQIIHPDVIEKMANDIKIVYTGLRPGEKLYEELLMKEEGMQETANKLIHIGKPIEMDDEKFRQQLEMLDKVSNMKDIVAEIVPTYKRKVEV